jgi:hypothetical protein
VKPSAVGNDGRQTNERCHHVRTCLLRRLGELEASRAMAAAVGNGDTTLLHVWSPPAEQLADSFSTGDADTRLSADLELSRARAREKSSNRPWRSRGDWASESTLVTSEAEIRYGRRFSTSPIERTQA